MIILVWFIIFLDGNRVYTAWCPVVPLNVAKYILLSMTQVNIPKYTQVIKIYWYLMILK